MSRQNAKRAAINAILSLLASHALAEGPDHKQPIHIDADQGVMERAGQRRLSGNVRISQGSILLTADNATLLDAGSGGQKISCDGHPVKLRQRMGTSPNWLDARADRCEYDSITGDVRLLGNGWLKKGNDEVTGSLITYNTATEEIRAEGLHMTIKPN